MYQYLIYTTVGQANTKAQFAVRAGFPNIIRHIAINAPSRDEFIYVKKKHFHSVKVQNHVQRDAQMQVTNIVAMWPGSTHHSLIHSFTNVVSNSLQARTLWDVGLLGK